MSNPDIHTTEGWAIIDERGKAWGKMLFSTKASAEETMKRCCGLPYGPLQIAPAKRVEWYAVRPGQRTPTLHDQWVIGEGR